MNTPDIVKYVKLGSVQMYLISFVSRDRFIEVITEDDPAATIVAAVTLNISAEAVNSIKSDALIVVSANGTSVATSN